jgi:hypothetical protein
MVVRHDVDVESIGKAAILPPDLSPLQIGARGEFEGQGFSLIGRVRVAYEDGSWNEWCAVFGDGRYGWVAEAQGIFMVSFENALPPDFPSEADELRDGYKVNLAGYSYAATDRKETVCLGSEGELPFVASPGRKAKSIDFTGADGCFACAEFSESGARFFVGRFARFDDLKFSNLRAVPGWSEEALEPEHHQTTVLNCPNCGGAVSLRAAGFSMSATCGSCGALIDTATPELQLIRTAREMQRIDPEIPLGRRGVLFGINYEVIGFQRVKDQYSGWSEYLLFNPWQGFVWLVTYNGHWTFVTRLFERLEVHDGGVFKTTARIKFQGDSYRIYAASSVSTSYVLGEFYWKVRLGMEAHVTDFISPPRILSREAYPNLGEETWSQGEYVQPGMIEQAFNLEQPLAEPVGTYLNQPNPYAEKLRQLKWLAPVFILVLLVIQMISRTHAAGEPVLSGEYVYHAGATNPVIVTRAFEVKGINQALEVTIHAPVDNNWLEVDADLVNTNTGSVVATFEQGIEYYHGYDDGPWSEGSQDEHRLIPGIPPGQYYLTLEVSADPAVSEMSFDLTVVRDVIAWSNFWIALGLLVSYPLYCWIRANAFERARWMESDFSPYSSSSEDDD